MIIIFIFILLILLEFFLRLSYLSYLSINKKDKKYLSANLSKIFFGNIDIDSSIFQTKFGKIQDNNLKDKFRYKPSEEYLNISHADNLEIVSSANGISKKEALDKFTNNKAFEELRYKPYLGLFTKPNQKLVYANINKFGFQMKSKKIEKPFNVKRVIILGGSSAFGYGSFDENNNITNLLEKYLNNIDNNNKYKWEVINLAFVASQTLSDLNLLNMSASVLKPDYVIHLTGYNDFFYFFHSNRHSESNKKLFQFHGSKNIEYLLYGSKYKKIINSLPSYIMIIRLFKKLFLQNNKKENDQIYTVF